MSHEPKLTVFTIRLKPVKKNVENSNRFLFKNLIGETNSSELEDSYIYTELFRKFIHSLDTPEMYSEPNSKKCMTANQVDIEDPDVNPNILIHSEKGIIEGKVEGGTYGKKRKKTSTIDKSNKDNVNEGDAITDDFYFLLYMPLQSNKIVLMLQSYSDDRIDSVMKKFCHDFFSFKSVFHKPEITRFVPQAIIHDFKKESTVSSIMFSTEIAGETLLESTQITNGKNYNVTVRVTPTKKDFTIDEFNEVINPIQKTFFTRLLTLGDFTKRKGTLKDSTTDKTSPFDLGSSFDIQPIILLSKYIEINHDETDFIRIKNYCLFLLEDIKKEIYTQYAVQER